jgi:hypothetical protein
VWKALGVEPSGDTVQFVDSAPMARIREAMTYGSAGARGPTKAPVTPKG